MQQRRYPWPYPLVKHANEQLCDESSFRKDVKRHGSCITVLLRESALD